MLSDTLLHTFGYTEIFTFVEIELFIFYPTVPQWGKLDCFVHFLSLVILKIFFLNGFNISKLHVFYLKNTLKD